MSGGYTMFLDSDEQLDRLIWSLQLLKARWPDLHEIRDLSAIGPHGNVIDVTIRRGTRREDLSSEYLENAKRVLEQLMEDAMSEQDTTPQPDEQFLYLRLVQLNVGTNDNGSPTKRSGRSLRIEVVRGEEVLGQLGGVSDVTQTYELSGFALATLQVVAFHQDLVGVDEGKHS